MVRQKASYFCHSELPHDGASLLQWLSLLGALGAWVKFWRSVIFQSGALPNRHVCWLRNDESHITGSFCEFRQAERQRRHHHGGSMSIGSYYSWLSMIEKGSGWYKVHHMLSHSFADNQKAKIEQGSTLPNTNTRLGREAAEAKICMKWMARSTRYPGTRIW